MQVLAANVRVPLASWSPLPGSLHLLPEEWRVCNVLYRWSKTATATCLEPRLRAAVEDGDWRGRRALPSDYFGDH